MQIDGLLWAIFALYLIANATSAATAWFGRYRAAIFGLCVSAAGFVAAAVVVAPGLAESSDLVGHWAARVCVAAAVAGCIVAAFALRRRPAAPAPQAEPDYAAIGQAMVEQMDARIAERRDSPRSLFEQR